MGSYSTSPFRRLDEGDTFEVAVTVDWPAYSSDMTMWANTYEETEGLIRAYVSNLVPDPQKVSVVISKDDLYCTGEGTKEDILQTLYCIHEPEKWKPVPVAA